MMNDPEYSKIPITAGMFVLRGHEVVPCEDILEWGQCFESKERIVAQDEIGQVFVSTVFLGVDHGWGSDSEGLLFETMVFGDDDCRTTRYRTWNEAESGHKRIVEEIEAKK